MSEWDDNNVSDNTGSVAHRTPKQEYDGLLSELRQNLDGLISNPNSADTARRKHNVTQLVSYIQRTGFSVPADIQMKIMQTGSGGGTPTAINQAAANPVGKLMNGGVPGSGTRGVTNMALQVPVRPVPWRDNYAAVVGSPEYQYNQQLRDYRNALDDPEYQPQANMSGGNYAGAMANDAANGGVPGGGTAPSSLAGAQGMDTPDTTQPGWWKNYSITALKQMLTPQQLATLPREALVQFPRDDVVKMWEAKGYDPEFMDGFDDTYLKGMPDNIKARLSPNRQAQIGFKTATSGGVGAQAVPGAGQTETRTGMPDDIMSLIGQDPNSLSAVNKAAYTDFNNDPYGAAANLTRLYGYNPEQNPYTQKLAGNIGAMYTNANFLKQLNGGDPYDFTNMNSAADEIAKQGLAPIKALQTGVGADDAIAKLRDLITQGSTPGSNMGISQRNLANEFIASDTNNSNNVAKNYGNTLGNLFEGAYGGKYASGLTSMIPKLLREYSQYVAPRNPNSNFLDWISGKFK